MRNPLFPGVCLLLLFACTTAAAQDKIPVNEPDRNRPTLFANLPDKINVDISDLQSIVGAQTGKSVSLRLRENALQSFKGEVISRSDDNRIQSVVIRSTDFNGATLTLSSSAQPNGTVKFSGRIISLKHADAYELQKQNDQYIFIKKNFYDIINE